VVGSVVVVGNVVVGCSVVDVITAREVHKIYTFIKIRINTLWRNKITNNLGCRFKPIKRPTPGLHYSGTFVYIFSLLVLIILIFTWIAHLVL